MKNSIILQNMNADDLKTIIGKAISKELKIIFQTKKEEIKYKTRNETAKKLRISLPTLNHLTKTGKITGYKIGSRILYREDEINQCLSKIETLKYSR